MKKSSPTQDLMNAIALGDLQGVRDLADNPLCNCKHQGSKPLREAVKLGHIEIVSELLPHSNVASYNHQALLEAAKSGRADIVDLLLPCIDSTFEPEDALNEAIILNHWDVFERLLPRMIQSPRAIDRVVRTAAQHGRDTMLKSLLPHRPSEPCQFLKWAVRAQSCESVEILLPVSDISDDFFAAWRWAFTPFSPNIIEALIPYMGENVSMFNHFGLAYALLENDIPLAETLFALSIRERVLNDVIEESQDLGRPSDQERVVQYVQQWLNEEQAQRIESTLEINGTKVLRRKL